MKENLSASFKTPAIASAAICLAGISGVQAQTAKSTTPVKPNIVLILVDDMGYSDLGCFGSEIHTPNLDALAKSGLRLTQFYNTGRSCPTRASLLTGLVPQQAGVGWMVDCDLGYEGYVGNLTQNSITLPELLRTAGYSTYMSGKWHVTSKRLQGPKSPDRSSWPMQRGFDRYFGLIAGASNYWHAKSLFDGNRPYADSVYFLTDMIGDHAVRFIRDHEVQKPQTPFFLYVAFNAPHWPLQAREKTIRKYADRYRCGWDKLRQERYSRMIRMGLVDPAWELTPRDSSAVAWSTLGEAKKCDMERRMVTYAAQVDEMDQQVGHIVAALKKSGCYDNTVVIFLSDNGACAEHISSGEDKSVEGIGSEQSWESYRLPWANASNTPFRLYKHWMHEGGISAPFIVHWSDGIKSKGALNATPATLIDIMATFVELSGATYPAQRDGHVVPPMEGMSLLPVFQGGTLPERYIFLEHEANRMARKGQWKIVERASYTYPFVKKWELYDMQADRSEMHNLADRYPQRVAEMAAAWDHWAETHMVLPLDGREHGMRIKHPIFDFPSK